MKIFKIKCDFCPATCDAEYDGEHWLAHPTWFEIVTIPNYHHEGNICPKCFPRKEEAK